MTESVTNAEPCVTAPQHDRWPWVALIAAVGLSHATMVYMYLHGLWRTPHYGFFPFAIVAAMMLMRRGWKETSVLKRGGRAATLALYTVAVALLVLGTVLVSPWLAVVALLFSVLAVSLDLGGPPLLYAVAPGWVMLLTLVRLPLSLDGTLTLYLQQWTSTIAGMMLDVFGVVHLRDGVLIQLPDRVVEVEAACSGINSLFAVLGATVFYLLWLRRPWWHVLATLAAIPLVVIITNVTRVVSMTLAPTLASAERYPARHAAFGVVCFLAAVGLAWCADRLVCYVGAWRYDRYFQAPQVSSEAGQSEPSPQRVLPNANRGVVTVSVVFGLIAVGQLVATTVLHTSRLGVDPVDLPTLSPDAMPVEVGVWRQIDHNVVHRSSGSAFGEHSQQWMYTSAIGTAIVSFDYPFDRWHNLTTCYELEGWTTTRYAFETIAGADRERVPVVAVHLDNAAKMKQGCLLFTLVDREGRSEAPANVAGAPSTMLRHRLRRAGLTGPEALLQVQVMVHTNTPISESDRDQVTALMRLAIQLASDQWSRAQASVR